MKVDTEGFSGPLDLLLSLIEKKQIDICEVSISDIADDYLEQVSAMEWLDIDQAAEFLMVAVTLLYIKVRALLPPDEVTEQLGAAAEEMPDPRAELVARLVDYRRYRDAARLLRSLEAVGSRMYTRPPRPLPTPTVRSNPVEGVTGRDLLQAYLDASSSIPEEFPYLPADEIPIATQMVAVLVRLARRGKLGMFEFLGGAKSRHVLVSTILAVLELVRRGRISASQPAPFGEIWMFPTSQAMGGAPNEPTRSAGGN
ncbi:MAG: segregation and condensation protein A [Bacillota bacterium]|jgi:segregation and condensation protein A